MALPAFFRSRTLLAIVLELLLLGGSGGGYLFHVHKQVHAAAPVSFKTPDESDPYVRFEMEAYDTISSNYWQKISDSDLAKGYLQLLQTETGSSTLALPSADRAGLAKTFSLVFKGKTDDEKQQLVPKIIAEVLQSLPPLGRSQLFSTVQQKQFVDSVNNVHTDQDLYNTLGVGKDANVASVQQAFQEKQAELAATTTDSGKAELAAVEHAHDVLANPVGKTIYDQTGAEPTVFTHTFGKTLYIYIKQMAATTLAELNTAIANSSDGKDTMILDLRGNIGGDLSFAQPFLSLFLGPNQYAFDFFHQGDYQVQRTPVYAQLPQLQNYREIALLTDGMTQSTSEIISAALKRDRIAKIVGTKTRGWGSAEQLFPMQTSISSTTSYSLLLVVDLSVRDDQNPIEGNGVIPNVDISQPDWKAQLPEQFFSADLISALEKTADKPPLQ